MHIRRDPEQPGAQVAVPIDAGISAVGAQAGVLEQVERVLAVAGQAVEEAEDFAFMAAHQFFERGR